MRWRYGEECDQKDQVNVSRKPPCPGDKAGGPGMALQRDRAEMKKNGRTELASRSSAYLQCFTLHGAHYHDATVHW